MKKLIWCIALAAGIGTSSFAQEPSYCGTYQKMNEYKASLSPQDKALYELEQEAYKQRLKETIAEHPEWLEASHERGTIQYTIPVVFHILHQGGSENISNEQVYNAMEHMNEDYQKSNPEWPNVVAQFAGIVADVEIKFVLAKKDPNGNCTNGITRTFTRETSSGNGESQMDAVKAAHGNWPGDEYLNIFVCKYIGGAAGYTKIPSGYWANTMKNGIWVLDNYVGSIGTSSSSGAHTLTHEVGHWLSLDHTWGPTNNPGLASNCNPGVDDGISDTPNTKGWTSCNLGGSTCNHPSVLDNVENYMEYSYCSKMFTEGQKAQMWAALGDAVTGRKNIVSASNLTATGVNAPSVLCKADFNSNKQRICLGSSVAFSDLSYNAATSWKWSFPGGTPATSTDQNPSVTYNTPGAYNAVLIASDGTSTDTLTRMDYITVLPSGTSIPFTEGFEDYTTLNNSPWAVHNPEANAAFKITSNASYSGNKSIVLKNYGEPSGVVDEILSSPIDLSSITSGDDITLSFRFAYRKRTGQEHERLQVLLSKDCGVTWQIRKTLSGSSLGNKISEDSWTPDSISNWETVIMSNITSQYWVDNFMLKFKFESDGGNNLYIDDINIFTGGPENDPLTVDKNEIFHSFYIFPNPTKNGAKITFSTGNGQKAEVSLVDMMGQRLQVHTLQAQKGKNTVQLNTQNIDSGIYFVNLNIDGIRVTKRLIIH